MKDLNDIMGALKEWVVYVPSTYSIHIEFLHSHWCGSYASNPMQNHVEFLEQSCAKFYIIGYARFLLLLARWIKWLREINVQVYHVVVVLPTTKLEIFVVPARYTQFLVYVLRIFLIALAKVENAKHLKKNVWR